MSMFNADQRDWMKSLAAMPKEAKCDCGWDRRGHCFGACCGHPEKGGAMPRDDEGQDDGPCSCGRPANHKTYGATGPVRRCCRCHVAAGNPPDGRHPGCLAAREARATQPGGVR